jgi:phage baseplate assembly protein W
MKAITFPFTIDPFGVANTTTSQEKIYQDRVLTLLSTSVGERPMRATYGTDLASALFETQGNATKAIESAIRTAMRTWIPELTVESIDIRSTDDSGRVQVLLSFVLPDFSTTAVTIYSTTLNPDGSTTR